ncbi:hypothetical protein SNE40_023074 [Patella caerulea]|uniref:Apple domain-containing protein n=1 Tax=Patella caerulea TaxID=87958 RepID=A0AAN8FXN0_PATCE
MQTLIFFLVSFGFHGVVPKCPDIMFKLIPFKDTLVDNTKQLYTNLTVKECGEKCVASENCASFSYKLGTGGKLNECYVFEKRVWSGQSGQLYDGLVTYWRLEGESGKCERDETAMYIP